MNQDRFDARLQAAFAARLDAAAPPADAVFARTMAAIDAEPRRPARRNARARWWDAPAAPARFATAAAIVSVGGTVTFGTVKAVRERIVIPQARPATRITLDRWAHGGTQLARNSALELTRR